jgi:hypothetical protein
MTFLWAAVDGRSPLDVWIATIIVMAALAVFVFFVLRIFDRLKERRTPQTQEPIVREGPSAPSVVANPIRDVTVGEAMAYLGFHEWEKTFFDAASSAEMAGAKLYDNLLQAAADGIIPIWGKSGNQTVYEPIPREFWYENRIDWFSLLRGSAVTESSKHTFNGGRYLELMTSRAAVKKLRPANEPPEIAECYPNVRAADNPSIHDEILKGPDRQKFLGLLSSGMISAWARPMVGSRDYMKIPETEWDTHKIDVHLHCGDSIGPDGVHRVHHQSYLRKKTGAKEATHYDVAFNRSQMKRIWPHLSFTLDDGSGQ